MADTIYDPNNVPHSNTVLRFKGSQLYLDNVPTIVDNGNDNHSFTFNPIIRHIGQ